MNEDMAEFINPLAYLGEQMTKFTMAVSYTHLTLPTTPYV